MLERDDELVSWQKVDKLHYSSNKNRKKEYKHDTLWLMQKRNYEVTDIINKDNREVTESADDAEQADRQMCSMLNYTEQEVNTSAWLTELLSSDIILRNDMQEVSETNYVWDR